MLWFCYLFIISTLFFFQCKTQDASAYPTCTRKQADLQVWETLLGEDSGYNKQIPGRYPAKVEATFLVQHIIKVDEVKGNMEFAVHFIGRWWDERLNLGCYPPSGTTTVPLGLQEMVWRPQIAIGAATMGWTMSVPQQLQRMELRYDGRIKVTHSFQTRVPCGSDYKRWPFDRILCNFYLAGNTPPDLMELSWIDDHPVKIPPWLSTPTFDVITFPYAIRVPGAENDTNSETLYSLSNSPEFAVTVGLKRQQSYYILAMYLPNMIIVAIAWFSMWFPLDSTRVSICLTCIVSGMLQYISVTGELPIVGYIKAIDTLMLGCLLFLAALLLEYTVLMALMRDKSEDWIFKCGKDGVSLKKVVRVVDEVMKWAMLVLLLAFFVLYFMYVTGNLFDEAHNSEGTEFLHGMTNGTIGL